MNERRCLIRRRVSVLYGILICVLAPRRSWAEPKPEAAAGYDAYVARVEARLGRQHASAGGFLAEVGPAWSDERLRRGELVIEQLTQRGGMELPGALLHDWRGTAFARGATAAEFERLLRDLSGYPRYFSPQVLDAKAVSEDGDRLRASMRVRQKHVLTVVMDTSYDVAFGRLHAGAGYSASRSTRVYEIGSPGTARGRVLGAGEEHGFLWRLNTYWTYQEGDGGLYLQVESVSLSRSVPAGLGWAVGPFVESVPRESLEFTLRGACAAVKRKEAKGGSK